MENKTVVIKQSSYVHVKHRGCHNFSIADVPEMLRQWNYEKNVGISPGEIYYSASENFWWLCPKCGHTWEKSPYAMIRCRGKRPSVASEIHAYGCPACRGFVVSNGNGFNSVAAVFPDIAELWDYEKNGDDTPHTVVAHTGVPYWIKCKVCGKSRKIKPRDANRAVGCMICGIGNHSSRGEQFLFANVSKFFQCAIGNCRDVLDGRELDIYVPETPNGPFGIEYNGDFWHSDDEEVRKWKYDECRKLGITLIDVIETTRGYISGQKRWCDHVFVTRGRDHHEIMDEVAASILRLMGIDNPEIINYKSPLMDKILIDTMRSRMVGQSVMDSEKHRKSWRYDLNEVDPSFVSAKEKRAKFWFTCWNCGKTVLLTPYAVGSQKYCTYCTPPNRPIPVEQWSADRKTMIAKFESAMEAERKLGFSASYITAVTRGRHDLAYGFYWKKSDQYNR